MAAKEGTGMTQVDVKQLQESLKAPVVTIPD